MAIFIYCRLALSFILGYGIYTLIDRQADEILLEYKGQLITSVEADKRQKIYAEENAGCFLYHFTNHNGKSMW